ncbi:hypothetical protein [Glaciecola sp. SC05]|uniref:hypothetical protein n=1 Tax=Glaciecola sp. SC05 TaxID=1987355 RepID=UPI0035296659
MRYFLLSIVFLTGCNSTVTTLEKDTDLISTADKGYLLIGVETNRDLKSISISGPDNISLSHTDLNAGTNFILVDLSVGNYEINRITLDHWFRINLKDEENWQFTISSQSINYVGHLEIVNRGFFSTSARLELVNRSTEALEFMEDNFPTIYESKTLSYGGPGEDLFLEYLNSLRGAQ